MGVVYKARSLTIKRDVAVKMLTHVDEETIERFSREAAAMGQINHTAVVRIDDFGDSGKWGPYLAMAYVPGRDLGALVERGPVEVHEAVDLTLAICSGVSACHIHSIIHRDLKPTNVRVTDKTDWKERVKVLDFGLALPFDSPILKAYQTRITHVGAIPGTPRYIAPELLRHQQPTPACDQYGIASLLYLLLTGRAPFDHVDGDALIAAILHGDYVALRLISPETPPALSHAVARGLNVDPEQRFPSVDDFALAILPEASPQLRNVWTRYFANAKRPIDRRLVEPVSAYRPHRQQIPVAPVVAPMAEAPRRDRPSPVPGAPDQGPKRVPTPPAFPAPSAPAPQPPSRRLRSFRKLDFQMLFVFICGIALGCALTIAGFICFVLYQSYACPRELSSARPAVVAPSSPPINR